MEQGFDYNGHGMMFDGANSFENDGHRKMITFDPTGTMEEIITTDMEDDPIPISTAQSL